MNKQAPTPIAFPSVAFPSGTLVHADFATSLAGMLGYYITNPVEGFVNEGYRLHNHKGSILPRSRQALVEAAIKDGCTHILFVDSDMTFPAQTLTFLIEANVDVIAANCVTKGVPANPTAREKALPSGAQDANAIAGTPLYSRGRSGLQEVWRVGTGIMLVKMEVFNRIGPRPWFDTQWVPELQDHMGEDWYFCQLLEKAGIKIHVDHDFSQFVYHSGSFAFGHEHTRPPAPRILVPGGHA